MGLQPTRLFTEWGGGFFLALVMDVDAWAGRAGSDGAGRAGSDGADIYEWWPTRATGSDCGLCGLCGLCGPSDFEVLVYQGCLLVSVDECVCDGVGANDDVCG